MGEWKFSPWKLEEYGAKIGPVICREKLSSYYINLWERDIFFKRTFANLGILT